MGGLKFNMSVHIVGVRVLISYWILHYRLRSAHPSSAVVHCRYYKSCFCP